MELHELHGRRSRKRTPEKQEPAEAADSGRQLRPLLWNRIVGIGLIPFIPIFSLALGYTLLHAHAAQPQGGVHFWKSRDFQMFGAGAGVWLVLFCAGLKIRGEPWGLRAYVYGHELMHIVMTIASFGRIKGFAATREGGHVVTDKYNFLIALGPYLWPFYSVPVLIAWSISLLCWRHTWEYREWFLGAVGFTWMFHLTFTVWILPFGQSDFHGPGHIFSFCLVYLANTICLSGVLIVLAPEVTWHDYGVAFLQSAEDVYRWTGEAIVGAFHLLRGIFHRFAG